MWTFEQSTGIFYDKTGKPVEVGYAGHGEGLNNPAMQSVVNTGPLPEGFYTMGPIHNHPHVGKDVMQLFPHDSNEMFKRSGFFWHGDEIAHPGEHLASDGCPVSSHVTRRAAWDSGDHILHVVDKFNTQYPLPLETEEKPA